MSHGPALELEPLLSVAKKLQSCLDAVEKGFGLIRVKLETGSQGRLRQNIHHRVVEAACRMDNGNGTIAETVHLVETAGFISGRHQEEIGAGFNAMGKGFIEFDANLDPFGISLRHRSHHFFDFRITTAQNHQHHGKSHQVIHHFKKQVIALLGCQATDHSHQGQPQSFVGKSQLGQQRSLALAFPGKPGCTVVLGNERIRPGIPHRLVNPVQNPRQSVSPIQQHPIETVPCLLVLNFAAVAGTDGGQVIAVDQASFEKVAVTPKFHAVNGKDFLRKVGEAKIVAREDPLVSQVVNGEYGPGSGKSGVTSPQGAMVSGDQPRLPVVEMQNRWVPLEGVAQGRNGAAEGDIALCIIFVVSCRGRPIQIRAVIKFILFQKVERYP